MDSTKRIPQATSPRTPPAGRRAGPAVALVLLAPVIAEVLYGATRLSDIFVLVPEIMVWGCGALLIRECIQRWNKGWQSMLLMGLALAVAEEFLIQQTSIAPMAGLARHEYGRTLGINWAYLLWALGYEGVWVVLVPVQLAELLYLERRERCWLRTRGIVGAAAAFVLGAIVAWYGWTQRARVSIFHMAPFNPPPIYLLVGSMAILLLMGAAYALPGGLREKRDVPSRAPAPWVVGVTVCVLGSPWAALVVVGFGFLPGVPFQLVLAGGLAWAGFTFLLMRRWTASSGWCDLHRFALVFGGILACIIGGFALFLIGGARYLDWFGKCILDASAVGWLISRRPGTKRQAAG